MPNRVSNVNYNTPMNCLPMWDAKTIESTRANVDDINVARRTRSQKYFGNVALMAHVLKTCNPNTYSNT